MINGKPLGLCSEPFCKKKKRKDRNRCFMHDGRRNHAKHPMMYAFHALKNHAKERGISFRLTFPIFTAFALQSDYLNKKGNGKKCLTVDRINNLRGYVRGNIQPLTRERNREKQAKVDAIRHRHGMKWKQPSEQETA